MKCLQSTILGAVLVGVASADYIVQPSSVPKATRDNWCVNELSTCPLICQQVPPGTTLVNTCDADSLTYGCLCGNNQQPNLTEYTLTLPFFTCQEWGNQCAKACGSDSACVSSCRQDHPCGALDPPKNNTANATSTSASGSSTATATATTTSNQVFTGFGSSATASTVPHGGGSMASSTLELGAAYSMAIVFGTIFAGFAML